MVEPDCHACIARRLRGGTELLVGLPLQVLKEFDLIAMIGSEFCDFSGFTVTIELGPVPPRIIRPELIGQRLKDANAIEHFPARELKAAKRGAAFAHRTGGLATEMTFTERAEDKLKRVAL